METTPALLTAMVPVDVPADCTSTLATEPLSLGPVAGLTVADPFSVTAAGLL
jgi:hypothetical protein